MKKEIVFFVSDCCGVESDKDHEVCSRCGEHCEIITETYDIVSWHAKESRIESR
jgi:hypothetical protein